MYQRPTLSVDDVPSLVLEVYGLKVNVVKELGSYDDRIFLVHVLPESSLPPQLSSVCAAGYSFKVLNAIDSLNADVIDIQTQISLHAKAKGFPTSCPVLNLDGKHQKLVTLPQCNPSETKKENVTEKCVVRLFEFIAGTTLEKVPLTPTLCEEIGEFAARLDIALETFSHSDESALLKMVNKWNMSEIPRLRDVVHVIADEEQRSVVTEVITSFEQNVLTRQEEYTKGLIHGDFNDGNILVSQDESPDPATMSDEGASGAEADCEATTEGKETGPTAVSTTSAAPDTGVCKNTHLVGIIDFGDSTVSLYIFEVAIAIMYAMLNRNDVPPMEAGARILAGYWRHKTLSQMEIRHLKLCICARFAQSFTMGYYALSLNPENSYVINHAQHIWPLLSAMWRGSDEEILQQLTKYCNCNNGVQLQC